VTYIHTCQQKKIQLNLKDNNNFNERTNSTLNQQQDAIYKTLDNTLKYVKRTTDEATREIPRYTLFNRILLDGRINYR
jgi:hypothetical protein